MSEPLAKFGVAKFPKQAEYPEHWRVLLNVIGHVLYGAEVYLTFGEAVAAATALSDDIAANIHANGPIIAVPAGETLQ
jgi:hypothetical protein